VVSDNRGHQLNDASFCEGEIPGGGQTLPGNQHSGAEARTGSEVSGLNSDGQQEMDCLWSYCSLV